MTGAGASKGPTGPPERAAQAWDVRRHAELDSTNRVVVDMAREGAPDGVVVVADHQTAGRGRLGRTWESPPGSSLLASVLLRTAGGGTGREGTAGGGTGREHTAGGGTGREHTAVGGTGREHRVVEPQLLHMMTVAAGVAAAEACLEVTGIEFRLKWPNDLVVDDLKLAGILSEFVPPDAVVVGLGLNTNWHQRLPEGATALNHLTGAAVDREALLQAFLPRLREGAGALGDPGARAELLDRYRRLCSTLGRLVAVRLGGGQVTGRAVGIGADGHLVIDREGQDHRVSAGAVAHLADSSGPG